MKVVVVGGTGLIGSQVVRKLNEHGHEAVPAAPNTGVNTLTGEGLAEVLQGASVVVDVSNSPSFEDDAVMEFFRVSTANLLRAEADAGVTHHVALSVVGTERLQASGYFRAKQAQEDMIKDSGIPYSIVHATQFFEFAKSLADSATEGDTVRVAPIKIQPIYSGDVAAAVGRTAVGTPINGTVEVAGPDTFQLEDFLRKGLAVRKDPRTVITAPDGLYWGAKLQESDLLPSSDAHVTETHFDDWSAQQH
ncbi:SDR family oxidoreductase [Streptomyces sp. NPDC050121]|uniref:SDR family oxidoreductase n=1 Tax=Streptomyces sp. NPDC050121 TaxID=3365601 RepID=UPI00378C2C16